MMNIVYILFSIFLFYVSYDIGKNLNLGKYISMPKEKIDKVENLKDICRAFSKIPAVGGVISLLGILLNSAIGMLSMLLTFGMLMVIFFIWVNSVKSVKNSIGV